MSFTTMTMSQALVAYLMAQSVEYDDNSTKPLFAGIWAIFGHGNVAGLGEALYQVRESFPTFRAHNEQGMAHAAIAYAKANNRRRMMACTSSIGPGATNMVTAAALAHVNRLPVLFLPGDVFATRRPDPVLQQLEDFSDPGVTVNDCFKPVSRYWDRINRPEQLLTSLPRAIQVLTDTADCGPVTLALPQDVQTMAYDYPNAFFAPQAHRLRRPSPDSNELSAAVQALRSATKPLIIAGGGVHYAEAYQALAQFAANSCLPVAETQAGKGALSWRHPCHVGAIGVTGSSVANALASEADLVLAIGTRLQDFTTASRSLFAHPQVRLININVAPYDAGKHKGMSLLGDARQILARLSEVLADYSVAAAWAEKIKALAAQWHQQVDEAVAATDTKLPTDAQVIGAVNRAAGEHDTVVCAAGGLPGELHKLWRAESHRSYHVEYGYSCMGYEIAGSLGVKMAAPGHEVFVMLGDGSYLMMNSELATACAAQQKLILVILDNHGFGCIHRLQQSCGGEPFNNLLSAPHDIDFVAHARALGAHSEKVSGIAELQQALERAKAADGCYAIVIETDPAGHTVAGGAWWDVPVAEHTQSPTVRNARERYVSAKQRQQ